MNFSNNVTADCLIIYTLYYLIVICDCVVLSQQYLYVIVDLFYIPRTHVVPSVNCLNVNRNEGMNKHEYYINM
jgi:hypothetical protein